MKRRIIKIAITIVICTLLVIGINFAVGKVAEIRSKEQSLQQEALKNKKCNKVFKFDCSNKTGKCKMDYNPSLYECTKEGNIVYLIVKITSIIIISIGIITIIFTIFRNRIL